MPGTNTVPDSDSDGNFELWKRLDHTRFMIGRLREMELSEFGLTPEQSHVLDILSNSGGVTTMNDIVKITQRQHHSISTLINRMSKQGLVRKKKSREDNRKYDVVITKRGQGIVKRMTRESMVKIFSILTEKEKQDLDSQLKRLLKQAYVLHGKSDQMLSKQQ